MTLVKEKKEKKDSNYKSWIDKAIRWKATPKDLRDPKTVIEFCKKNEINRREFYRECDKKEFKDKILDKSLNNVQNNTPNILHKLSQIAENGNLRAIEMYLKYILKLQDVKDNTFGTKDYKIEIIQVDGRK
ncbi:MAG: hypothetical protein GF335_02065 [Candidatus Moranbacteria bacterium]|nr:hypothetical protein [Candidatus Moranbacteria bacterium]